MPLKTVILTSILTAALVLLGQLAFLAMPISEPLAQTSYLYGENSLAERVDRIENIMLWMQKQAEGTALASAQ